MSGNSSGHGQIAMGIIAMLAVMTIYLSSGIGAI